MVRDYIESFSPIIMRPTGGAYFVGAQHARILGALREMVGRFGRGGNLNCVPIADQDEMREMVIAAFIARAGTELQKLANEIATAQQGGATAAVAKALWERFSELQKAAAEHEAVLSGAVGDTEASMRMVELQLTDLLMGAGTGGEGQLRRRCNSGRQSSGYRIGSPRSRLTRRGHTGIAVAPTSNWPI